MADAGIAKICVLGDFAVGKTTIVHRLVTGQFDESIITTVGATVETLEVGHDGSHSQDSQSVFGKQRLVVWDIAGVDHLDALRTTYITGMTGYILVCDSTRRPTLNTAQTLHSQIVESCGDLPFCLMINKVDLSDENEISSSDIVRAGMVNWSIHFTSARTG